ncbi:metallophosphoesterase [Endozoicomonas euniceicola]|uniref:Metallophosphoesterase n=1 Tax=Endozoicomonas euniceicola TaxID=1234143 RepID=A0ABY6GYU7_9GAMM|nr:metallophosphoesterase [Endozoicomonas euniceicola]UYM17963.1 metallophosphoesterase [Endozoicomonas euniceicola]
MLKAALLMFSIKSTVACVTAMLITMDSAVMAEEINISLHSDLHNEMQDHSLIDEPKVISSDKADIFVLAGDIHNGIESIQYAKSVAKKHNKPVIFIAGNHEYYGHDLIETEKILRKESSSEENVYFLEKDSIVLNNIRFLGCTLWSNFELYEQVIPGSKAFCMAWSEGRINDFSKITMNNRAISSGDMENLNQDCMQWLQKEFLMPHSGPTVVITHFAPVPDCVDEKWKKEPPEFNELSPYFVNNLTEFITTWQPDFWFYGHTHSNICLKIGKTQIISNQKGYPSEEDSTGYRPDMLIKVNSANAN